MPREILPERTKREAQGKALRVPCGDRMMRGRENVHEGPIQLRTERRAAVIDRRYSGRAAITT